MNEPNLEQIHFLEKFFVTLSLDECAARIQNLHEEGSWFHLLAMNRVDVESWNVDQNTLGFKLTQLPKQKGRILLFYISIYVYCTKKNKSRTAIWIGYFPNYLRLYLLVGLISGSLSMMGLASYSQDGISFLEIFAAFFIITISTKLFLTLIKFYYWSEAINLVRKVKKVLEYPLGVV